MAAASGPTEALSAALIVWTVRASTSRSDMSLVDLECRITPEDCCDEDE